MYADRIEGESKSSIRDRLNSNANANANPGPRHTVTGKRQRQDDKWEHDLFDEDHPEISKLGVRDLRLKLQKKSNQQYVQGGGVRDLRDSLNEAKQTQLVKKNGLKTRPALDAPKPARRSVIAEVPIKDVKKASNATLKKKTQPKSDASVDEFLQSIGLEKYQIQFHVEEVDMTALEQMTDDDLKAMGIPMGPRKKIILALNSTR